MLHSVALFSFASLLRRASNKKSEQHFHFVLVVELALERHLALVATMVVVSAPVPLQRLVQLLLLTLWSACYHVVLASCR